MSALVMFSRPEKRWRFGQELRLWQRAQTLGDNLKPVTRREQPRRTTSRRFGCRAQEDRVSAQSETRT